MRDQTTRRAMPVEQSILWKPFHDSHYVVASLQPGDGGRRKIFVRQSVVARIEALVRAHGRRTVGLLLGQSYQCPITGSDYIIIDSIAEHAAVSDDNDIEPAVAEALVEHRPRLLRLSEPPPVVGWYRGVPKVEAKLSLTMAGVHASLFTQPWQTTLIVGEGTNASSGAFFLRDAVNSRWFYAPFYELLTQAPAPGQAKETLINWPEQYLTADAVVAAPRDRALVVEPDVRPKKTYERPWLRRSPAREERTQPPASEPMPFAPPSPHDSAPPPLVTGFADREVEPGGDESKPASANPPVPSTRLTERLRSDASATDRPVARPVHGAADVPRIGRERPRSRRAGSGEKLSIVDDRDQRTTVPPSPRIVGDDEDTTLGDDPGRYIELARSEGFFIAGRFDTIGEMGRSETVWVLNEPYSGMLLAVVTTAEEIVDATLHYNLQTDDAGLAATPFPEHRDAESKTIYVRESCGDSLRARCRRLRATNALLREWKVTPPIWFLTPAEWESIPASDPTIDRGRGGATDLNKARIAELPSGGQFHLTDGGEATA